MLRNVTINTSVGPLVGIAAENGVVYINGTPHALTMYGYDKQTPLCVIPLSGTVVRVPDEYQPLPETFPGIPETLNINHPDQCVGLPDPIHHRVPSRRRSPQDLPPPGHPSPRRTSP